MASSDDAIAGLIVEIKGNINDLENALKKAQGQVDGFSKKANATLKSIGKNLAAGGLLYELGKVINGTTDQLLDLSRQSDKFNLPIDKLQGLIYAADQADVSTADLNQSLTMLRKNVGAAAQGTGPAKDALKILGLNAKALSQLSVDEQLIAISNALKKIGNESIRSSLQFQIFGKSAGNSTNLINSNIDESISKFKSLGFGLSDNGIDTLQKYEEATKNLKAGLKDAIQKGVLELTPAFQLAISSMGSLVSILNRAAMGWGLIANVVKDVGKSASYSYDTWDNLEAKRQLIIAKRAVVDQNTFNAGNIGQYQALNYKAQAIDLVLNTQNKGDRSGGLGIKDTLIDPLKNAKDSINNFNTAIDQTSKALNNAFSDAFSGADKSIIDKEISDILKLVPQKTQAKSQVFDQAAADIIDALKSGVNPSSAFIQSKYATLQGIAKDSSSAGYNAAGQTGVVKELGKFIEKLGGQKVDVNIKVEPSKDFFIRYTTSQDFKDAAKKQQLAALQLAAKSTGNK